MIEGTFFSELGIVLIVATLLGLLFQKFKQPLILAYIFTGVILGASFLNVLSYQEIIQTFSELGIAFLLFLVGLNLNINVLKEVGKISVITGIGQIFFTTLLGMGLAVWLGFTPLEALYLGIALSFSSTIIIVKLLSDKNELNSLHGKISVGFLLVQDFVAILALMMVSSIGPNLDLTTILTSFLWKGAVFFGGVVIITKFVLEKIFDKFAKSQELLFLASISWLLLLGIVSQELGFSLEIGALIAGVSLASIPYSFEISGKVKYLRDFFLVLFFVLLGSQLVFSSIHALIIPAVIFTLFILIGNPLIVAFLMLFMGYRSKTAFLSGLTVAQISEFSLILIALGLKAGHLTQEVAALATVVGVVTIAISTLLIQYSQKLYPFAARFLDLFAKKKSVEDALHQTKEKQYRTILIGFNRTGKSIIRNLKFKKNKLLIIDFDPAMIKKALALGYHAIYGDSEDPEVITLIQSLKPKMIISTTKDFEGNVSILRAINKQKKKPLTIILTEELKEAQKLESLHADVVIVPTVLAGHKIKKYVHAAMKSKHALNNVHKKLLKEMEKF